MYNSSSITEVASKLNIPESWLERIIKKESGGNPQAKNPYSSARGLIQFMDDTAKDMGYSDSLDLVTKYPDFDSQIKKPVYDYLKRYAPFANEAELYLSVFYPAYRKKNYDFQFPERIQKVNVVNGVPIKTPAHYVAFVKGKIKEYDSGKISMAEIVEENYLMGASDYTVEEALVITPEDSKKKVAVIASLTAVGALIYYLSK